MPWRKRLGIFRGKGQLARSWDQGSMRCFFMSVSGRRHGNAAVANGQLGRSWQCGSTVNGRSIGRGGEAAVSSHGTGKCYFPMGLTWKEFFSVFGRSFRQ